ncbi:MAG: UrcA family protein [Caulobacterales bacterium]|jgi:UrcA family protein
MRLSALATLTAATALLGAAPALAQTIDELTVTGQLAGPRAQSLSEAVSYADLDLTAPADRDRLRMRVNDTARRICTRLNQDSPSPANLGRSCQDVAVRDAMDQVHEAFADASSPAYVEAYGAPASAIAPADYDAGPIPDTPENRARFGGPRSRAGERTRPYGN